MHLNNRKLQVEYVDAGQLKPNPAHARRHPASQLKKLSKSIQSFGFSSPILVDEDLVIIAGHARWEAAKKAGYQSVPVIKLSGLSSQQQRALALADNKIAEEASWDTETLRIELQTLLDFPDEIEIEITGFEMGEIDFLLMEKARTFYESEEVPQPDIATPPVSRIGDLWILGSHRLLCGDATKEESYAQLLKEERADMVFTDPPYNVAIQGHVSGRGQIHHSDFVMASGEMSSEEFTEFLSSAMDNLTKYSEDGSIHFICMDWRHLEEILQAGHRFYGELKNICVWVKTNGGMGSLYRSRHELIFVFKNGQGKHINNVQLGRHGRYRSNVWTYPGATSFGEQRSKDLHLHPTVKPVQLIADAIMDCSNRGDLILDAFAGSGSTLIACELTGRRAVVMELDPHYVDTAIVNFEQRTGQKAKLEATGETFDEIRQHRSH